MCEITITSFPQKEYTLEIKEGDITHTISLHEPRPYGFRIKNNKVVYGDYDPKPKRKPND